MHTLETAFDQGDLLTTHEGKEYRRVALICVKSADGIVFPYCTTDTWDADPIASLARKDEEIALLQKELEALRARLLDVQAKPITIEDALKITAGAPPPPQIETGRTYACPRCEFRSFTPRGISLHAWAKHKMRVAWGSLDA